ncbi:unnamed protein product [Larinioides sclopetarius]|uniref:Uncharacterized protein n=1 Tax=Larinioides sclopetarius TaxID=280406 RepID=A0AAV2AAX1_9ARAC
MICRNNDDLIRPYLAENLELLSFQVTNNLYSAVTVLNLLLSQQYSRLYEYVRRTVAAELLKSSHVSGKKVE